MTKKPLISIIMNCYNSDRYLKEAIDSIYAQTFTDWEIVFWDNVSTDSSAAIANSYDYQLKYYLADKNTPLGAARNLAMEKATGSYIAFLDCDDLYLPNKLEMQMQSIRHSKSVLCYGSAIIIDESGAEIRKDIVRNNSGPIFAELLQRYEINMQSVMLRRDVLEENNIRFDETFCYCPDYNMFMQVAANGSVAVIKECLVKYRKLENSLSSTTYHLIHKEMRATLDLLFRDKALYKRYKKPAGVAYKMLSYYEAIDYINTGDYMNARVCVARAATVRVRYWLLYFLLFLPVPSGVFMRKLVG